MVATLISTIVALYLGAFASVVWYIVVRVMVSKGHVLVQRLGVALELADVKKKPQSMALGVFLVGVVVWFLIAVFTHMGVLTQIITLPMSIGIVFGIGYVLLKRKTEKRRTMFMDQLEIALRLLSGGVRVGLSLPQAMGHITEEMTDPARTEFNRVIGQTRVGITTADALDALSERMSGNETLMLARVIRVQTQTGGSLSGILDHLAETIKERRYIQRKIGALTAEGRIGALVLEALPVGVGLFVLVIERPMGQALMGTLIGHIVLGWAVFLEIMAIMVLNNMLKVNV